jgi:cyclin-dependent kinase
VLDGGCLRSRKRKRDDEARRRLCTRRPATAGSKRTLLPKPQPLKKKTTGTYGKVYKAKDKTNGKIVALKKTRLEVRAWDSGVRKRPLRAGAFFFRTTLSTPLPHKNQQKTPQMEEEGVPSTTLREISLLKMLSESNHIVK